MKNLYTSLIAIGLALCGYSQSTVTLMVDMNNETVSVDGVHVAGNFQGWDPAATPMTDVDLDGVYEHTFTTEMDTIEFKFLNGLDWPFEEDVPDACQVEVAGNSNRFLVTSSDVSMEVCFASCAPCGMNTVRFRVDMSQEAAISPNGVHVAGNVQGGWDPSSILLSQIEGTMVYEVIYSFDPANTPDGTVVYKFINGNSWDDPNEFVPEDCGDIEGNRLLDISGENMVTDVYCYNLCTSCVSPTEVTFQVDMSLETVSPNGVHVALSFQGWDPATTELTDDDTDGVYEVTLAIAPGSYAYKFVNGNAWEGDDNDNESVPAECNVDGNRTVVVGEDPTTETYCYNQCGADCVEDPYPADITFRVNMADETVDADGVWLIGAFTIPQWQAGAVQLTDDDSDGVYEAVVLVSGGAEIQYKFTNGDPYPDGTIDSTVEENYDFATNGCGVSNGVGGFNRVHVRSGVTEDLDMVCYNSCADCGINVDEINDEIGLSVYPNPTNEILNVSISTMQNVNNIILIDVLGKVVWSNSFTNSGTQTPVSNLSTGIYTLSVNTIFGTTTSKVVKK
jgi:hypothetical protein